jgi:hypothetical protein
MKTILLSLGMASFLLSTAGFASPVCGQVKALTSTTSTAAPVDYSSLNQGYAPSSRGEPIVVATLASGRGTQDVTLYESTQARKIDLLTAAFASNAQVCYDQERGELSINR